eukprot:gnl/MRDRNA2_/MRDRNA2_54347_c0_seq1.p1 gnl/MRDRNA2_/MRDRNA2_54347_c0~~gnl/MRDRNA2_/MRDRNA2_54347_c0_seq1.p1  ORF type:complete len:313 (+),score=58.19 gnl/MRDRNA2_/MRDRNA2_54347_c0_seq1:62-1000(+)
MAAFDGLSLLFVITALSSELVAGVSFHASNNLRSQRLPVKTSDKDVLGLSIAKKKKSDKGGSDDGLVDIVDAAYPYDTTWDPREQPISESDRLRIEKANGAKNSSCSMGTATYGETEPEGQLAVLKAVGAKPGQRYYDLGAGLGRNVLVAWLWGMDATGVELSHEMFAYSCKRVSNVSAHSGNAATVLAKARHSGHSLRLVEADVALYDFSDADVVFMNDKCWSASLVSKLDTSFSRLRRGTKVISHKELHVQQLTFTKTVHAWMSWTLEPMAFNVYTAQGSKNVVTQSRGSQLNDSNSKTSAASCGISLNK